jgi:excisionase family DNA binding protein
MARRQVPTEIAAPVRRVLTVAEVAAALGQGESTIRRQIRTGTCPYPVRRSGRRVLIPASTFRAWLGERAE